MVEAPFAHGLDSAVRSRTLRRMQRLFLFSACSIVALLFALFIVDAVGFLAYGYPLRAVLLPIEVGVSALSVVATIGYALASRGQSIEARAVAGSGWTSPWTWVAYMAVWFVCLLGAYLHPTDELREAMEARAAAAVRAE